MPNKIPDKDILDDIKHIIEITSDTSFKNYKEHGKYSECAVKRVIGPRWNEYISSIGYAPQKKFNVKKSDVIEDVKNIFEKTGSTKQENYIKHGEFSRAVIKRLFGGWNEMLKELNIPLNMYKPGQYSKKDIIKDYERVKQDFGRPLNAAEYRKHGKYSQPIIDNIFGSFSNLKREMREIVDARFVSNEEIEEDMLRLHCKYGVLTQKLICEESIISYPTILARYGTMKSLCEAAGIPFDEERNKSKLLIQCLSSVKKVLGNNYELEKTFPWLRNPKTNRPMFIDIFYKEKNLAIEVDGDQHFNISMFTPTPTELEEVQARDRSKDAILKRNGYQVIRLTKPTSKYVEEKLKNVI